MSVQNSTVRMLENSTQQFYCILAAFPSKRPQRRTKEAPMPSAASSRRGPPHHAAAAQHSAPPSPVRRAARRQGNFSIHHSNERCSQWQQQQLLRGLLSCRHETGAHWAVVRPPSASESATQITHHPELPVASACAAGAVAPPALPPAGQHAPCGPSPWRRSGRPGRTCKG